ncbi:uncharacterized protein BDZ83DRAFT_646463 [Colletotrichum acutatum]|uniref:Uncharacterized protein n=1 Tax=Glomerella acutata TaxID=27357 RepID=A0AAD8XP21_GLOAC|nr:uncharacterized protein BDZ83DRAFT_646463 [Colletotrichum acutatum]KAK1731030.1 hypothetical protein BDZ83DRAFT_646463 [Colletotrichum acutatum]
MPMLIAAPPAMMANAGAAAASAHRCFPNLNPVIPQIPERMHVHVRVPLEPSCCKNDRTLRTSGDLSPHLQPLNLLQVTHEPTELKSGRSEWEGGCEEGHTLHDVGMMGCRGPITPRRLCLTAFGTLSQGTILRSGLGRCECENQFWTFFVLVYNYEYAVDVISSSTKSLTRMPLTSHPPSISGSTEGYSYLIVEIILKIPHTYRVHTPKEDDIRLRPFGSPNHITGGPWCGEN